MTVLTALRQFVQKTRLQTIVQATRGATQAIATLNSYAWRGATVGVLVSTVAVAAFVGTILKTGLGTATDAVLMALVTAALIVVTGLMAMGIFVLLRPSPPRLIGGLFGTIGAFAVIWALSPYVGSILVPAAFPRILAAAFAGGMLGIAFSRGIKKPISILLVVLAVSVAGVTLKWLADPGTDAFLVKEEETSVAVQGLDVPNPSEHGSSEVRTIFYGSGTDERRPEYGATVGLRTDTVDASPFLSDSVGFKARLRERYWGFDTRHFPINGRVWFPGGGGPSPLVLVVHGNHPMEEFSDPGYAYLGELLASRGFITVSVDENFLNSSWTGESAVGQEIDARAWMLLKHLQVWKKWNETPGHPFYRRVDMDNLALVGHSRGGEAIAIAAAFNKMHHYPDDATVQFDFNFQIKSLVAISPTDGLYKPANRPNQIENINYLLLQGLHDPYGHILHGERQYNRLKFTDGHYWFKSATYIYRANHGQFNTVWGRLDYVAPGSWLLNTRPLMAEEEQRQVARVYISAFLEATLRGQRSYIPLFRDHRRIRGWLPKDIYLTYFEDQYFKLVSGHEEDSDITTTTVPGGTELGENLDIWREQGLISQNGEPRDNQAVYLGWDALKEAPPEKTPMYSITLPDSLAQDWHLTSDSQFVFCLGNAAEEAEKVPDPVIEFIARDGVTVNLPLGRFASVRPLLFAQPIKIGDPHQPAERILQAYELPLSDFVKTNAQFNPANIKTIRFRFNSSSKGRILLDKVGFRVSPQEP